MTSNKTAAFFDLDGTLTRKDTFLEFLKFCRGKRIYFFCLLFLSPYIVLYYLKIYPNYKLKEKFFSFYFRGLSKEEVKKVGDEFSLTEMPRLVMPEAIQHLQSHKLRGHDVFILTASSDIWLSAWCEKLNLELISTKFQTQHGFYTGKIEGKNCYGIEKTYRIKELITDYSVTIGYGDSRADRPFLNLMNHGFNLSLTPENLSTLANLKDLNY